MLKNFIPLIRVLDGIIQFLREQKVLVFKYMFFNQTDKTYTVQFINSILSDRDTSHSSQQHGDWQLDFK